MKAHCLFEQSGTFKNEFKKLGIESYDYDILNDYQETDYQIDLFKEIKKAYSNKKSIFDWFSKEDIIFAFFPCIRFEDQALLFFRGEQFNIKDKSDIEKLQIDMIYHNQLNELYQLISKLVIIAIKKNLKLIIENPYTVQHYLTRYWCIKPSIIDKDRTLSGDNYKKPTQYYFINCEPKCNLILDEPYYRTQKVKKIIHANVKEHSLISKEYARRFIREYIL